MFTYKDTEYDLHFTIGRVKLIEAAMGKSIMDAFISSSRTGLMQISDIENCFAYGLKEAGSDIYVLPKAAREICDGLIEELGYMPAVRLIQAAAKRDLPFFFRTA